MNIEFIRIMNVKEMQFVSHNTPEGFHAVVNLEVLNHLISNKSYDFKVLEVSNGTGRQLIFIEVFE